MGCVKGFVKHLVCLLAFITWLLGAIILAYTLWVLSTSKHAKKLFTGELPVTYVALGMGTLLFINGLLGWVGSYKRGGCMLKMFLFICVLTIATEVGGIISLSILRIRFNDMAEQGWNEMNYKTRHLIQSQFSCCGLTGPSEFAHVSDPIDKTCYVELNRTELMEENGSEKEKNRDEVKMVLSRVGCKDRLTHLIHKHRMEWITGLGSFLLFQVLMVLLSVSAINNLKSRSSSMESLDDHHTVTYM